MPPRLPSLPRPKGYSYSANPFADVVQLGFLLPWANTTRIRSSSTTSTTSGICSASSGSSSSSSSSLKNCTEAGSSKSQTRPSPSFIHRNLSRPNAPSPSDLLNHLKARPSLLTRSSGELLARYSRRVSDLRSERESERFMIRRRVGPLTKSSHHHHHHKRYEGKGKGEGKGKSKEIDGYFQVPILEVGNKNDHPLRPNTWALNNFPPISNLPSRQYTSEQLLNHTHWLILRGQEPDFQNALGLLETTVDWKPTSGADKGRWRWETLNMLHLYLSYAGKKFQRRKRKLQSRLQLGKRDSPSGIDVDLDHPSQIDKFTRPSALLETYLSLNVQTEFPPPNRQTLHLLTIASLTFVHRHESTSTCDPKEILGIIDDFRKKYRITPGPETFRHVARTALKIDDAELAREAWVGWETAMRRLQSQVDWSQSDSAESQAQRQSSFRSKSQRDGEGEGEGEVRFRFRNIGTYKRRWDTVRRAIQEKGRVGEFDKEEEMNVQNSWRWMQWIARLESLDSKLEGASPPSSLPPSTPRPKPRPYSPFLLPVKPYSPVSLSNPFPFRYSPAPPLAPSPPISWNYQSHDESADEPEREAARATS